MAKIAWVDHSFHKKTKSSIHILNLLKKHRHTIDIFWDDQWAGGKAVDISSFKSYDALVLWQVCGKYSGKLCDVHPNITFIPMLDSYGITTGPHIMAFPWEKYKKIKVLNFSRTLHYICWMNDLTSKYFQFFLPPKKFKQQSGLHGFFWCRRPEDISWRSINKLIGNYRFDSFYLHLVPDNNFVTLDVPSNEDIKKHNITISTSWIKNKSLLDLALEKANIFFCPRFEEGIGMAMLEALSMGKCVVAPDCGTMNEYILNTINGILYDIRNVVPIDFNELDRICNIAYITAVNGYKRFMRQGDEIVDYIISPLENFEREKSSFLPFAKILRDKIRKNTAC